MINREGMTKEIARITRQNTHFNTNPIGYSPSKKHWTTSKARLSKFLCVNYVFNSKGTKIEVIGRLK